MEVIAVICMVVTGVFIGMVGLDYVERRAIRTDLNKTLAGVKDVHNNLISQVAALQEQVNAHEYRLKAAK